MEDIELRDDDVRKELIDGILSLDFSERVYLLIEDRMSKPIVLKLLGRKIGYNTLWNKVCSLWKLTMQFQLMDIKNGYSLEKFESL